MKLLLLDTAPLGVTGESQALFAHFANVAVPAQPGDPGLSQSSPTIGSENSDLSLSPSPPIGGDLPRPSPTIGLYSKPSQDKRSAVNLISSP